MRPVLVVMAVGMLLLAACGKKGPPAPAGPAAEITYPRSYPTH